MVHKVFVDSRAAKEGTDGDFVWAPDRPLSVGRCRAFIDSVHMPVSWGTIVETNKYMYVAEEMPAFTVLPTQAKVYLRENGVDRVVTLAASIVPPDNGQGLAQALATALGAGLRRGTRRLLQQLQGRWGPFQSPLLPRLSFCLGQVCSNSQRSPVLHSFTRICRMQVTSSVLPQPTRQTC